jgi:hypothetical protein
MTRKKVTTGNMGSKRKSDKTKASDTPSVAPSKAAPKAAVAGASRVIPAVPVALLDANPNLPDKQALLDAFAEYYRAAEIRAVELARKLSEPEPEPEVVPEPTVTVTHKKKRPPYQPPTLPSLRPVVSQPAPVLDLVRPAASAEPEPVAAEPEVEVEPETVPEIGEAEGLADALAEAEAAPVIEDDTADIFAMLQAEAEGKIDEDHFAVTSPSDQSNPFISTHTLATVELEAEPADEGATKMIAAFRDDDELIATPAPQLAEPVESTMLIQAMPDDEPAEPAEPEAGASTPATRKSRKASKKKRA